MDDEMGAWGEHPGVVWRELIRESGYTQTLVASHIGCSRQHLVMVLGQQVLPNAVLTVRFGRYMNADVRLLWRMVSDHMLLMAYQQVSRDEQLTSSPDQHARQHDHRDDDAEAPLPADPDVAARST